MGGGIDPDVALQWHIPAAHPKSAALPTSRASSEASYICTGGPSDTGGDEQAEQASEFSAVVEGIESLERDGRHQRFQEEATAFLNSLALRVRCYQPVMAGAALRKRRQAEQLRHLHSWRLAPSPKLRC